MNESLFRPGEKVLLACSGGRDSVYLLENLFRDRKRLRVELGVAHIDHGLRPDSAEDARFVRQLATQRKLPYFERTLCLSQRRAPQGIEALARQHRYEALEEIALAHDYDSIALAHHRNDQIETVLLRIFQGAAPRHWLGMENSRPIRKGSRIRLVRPLLGITREQIDAQLYTWQLSYREDSSNKNTRFLRNRMRQSLASLPSSTRKRIETQTLKLRDQAVQLEHVSARLRLTLLQGRLRQWEGRFVLDLQGLPPLDKVLIEPILESLFYDLGAKAPSGTLAAAVALWQHGKPGKKVLAPSGAELRRRGARIEGLAPSDC